MQDCQSICKICSPQCLPWWDESPGDKGKIRQKLLKGKKNNKRIPLLVVFLTWMWWGRRWHRQRPAPASSPFPSPLSPVQDQGCLIHLYPMIPNLLVLSQPHRSLITPVSAQCVRFIWSRWERLLFLVWSNHGCVGGATSTSCSHCHYLLLPQWSLWNRRWLSSC